MPVSFIRGAFWLFLFLTIYLAGAPIADPATDRAEDALSFFMLAFLLDEGWPRRKLLTKALVLTGFSLLIELAQSLIPGRNPVVWDVLFDLSGAGLYLLLRPLLKKLLSSGA